MHPLHRDRRTHLQIFITAALCGLFIAVGCASPGPPLAPTLSLPAPVRDLSASRVGDTVELHFTAPSRTTDHLPLRGAGVLGQFCRGLEGQPCQQVASSKAAVAIVGTNGTHNLVTWIDTLPPELSRGTPRLLSYRVEFFSPAGRSAGFSAPALTAAGPSPSPVTDLQAQGTRLGTLLSWSPSQESGDVLLHRRSLTPDSPKRKKQNGSLVVRNENNVTLQTRDPRDKTSSPSRTLDTSAVPDTPYRYSAQRRVILSLDGHSIDLRSAASPAISFTLRETYPPPPPTGLTALGFFTREPSQPGGGAQTFAVDLIWQPVDATGLLATLAGYNIYRATLDTSNAPTRQGARLNASPIPVPAFHDTTAAPATSYHYAVTAVDAKGNESRAATVILEASATH